MRKGKLSPQELQSIIFDTIKRRREEVHITAGIGEDCAAIKCEDYILVTTDPITTKCNNPARLAININANDIAASGGEPIAVTLTLLVPVGSNTEEIKAIMLEAEKAAEELNIEIVGGHTEFTDAVNRIVVNCTMLGRSVNPIATSGARDGDYIIMTKYAGIEGTLILAESQDHELHSYVDQLEYMRNNLSVIKEGQIAKSLNISSMHDITEGGVFGAVAELCGNRGIGAVIDVKAIPVLPVTSALTNKYSLDVYKLISSGSMLITSSEPHMVINKFESEGIKATIIGMINRSGKVYADYGSGVIQEVFVEADEILKINEDTL